jgi:glutamate-ammonia-ligase adenylyltransferase
MERSVLNLQRVLAGSRFVHGVRERHAALFESWLTSGWLERAPEKGEIGAAVAADCAAAADEAQLMRILRLRRAQEMTRIVAREFSDLAVLDETLAQLSDLADACCEAALQFASARLIERFGRPRDESGSEAQAVVLGMGKLGGRELNFSSDIDLIWAYTAPGETDGPRSIHNEEFFARLTQDVGRILSAQTEHGFVFRVDTMLRPFGSAGAMAWNFGALEDYYQVHGREWERYALIKARPIAGDLEAGRQLLATLRPFVYRRYLDFNAIGNLRELKRMIVGEVQRKNLQDNIKLGAGGIREIEFIVQSFQLIRGGQEAGLRDSRLRPVLRYLGEAGHLPPATAARLDQCYVFLRRLENAIQMYADEQTHALPASGEARSALCSGLGVADWPALMSKLDEVRGFVQAEFGRLFDAPAAAEGDSALQKIVLVFWDQREGDVAVVQSLREQGFQAAPEAVSAALRALRESRMVRALSETALQRLTALLPLLLAECLDQQQPEIAAQRVINVVSAIAGRSTYLTLLRESVTARQQLTRLCAASPWITELLARSPILLDQLLDPRTLYAPPLREEMKAELDQLASLLAPGDTEAGMDLLRRYRQETMLRIAACDLTGQLPLRKVCDHLTWLAETILERALRFAWDEMKARYGEPPQPAFAAVAYGKLGGIELGYGSDLDLVFLFDSAAEAETGGGPRSIAASEFYTKLAQRVIHWLSTQTPAGRAYEVDMQLRPSGASGLLVTSIAGFRNYQLKQAWTWEHQALARARAVAGDAGLRQRFEQLRVEILTTVRDPAKLRQEVLEMREKMHAHLEKRESGRFDLKQGAGGMTDLEFITQYLVLREAAREPALVEWPDNRRQLEALARVGVISAETEAQLVAIYDAYRAWFHARDLQQGDGLAGADQFAEQRSQITALWRRLVVEEAATR